MRQRAASRPMSCTSLFLPCSHSPGHLPSLLLRQHPSPSPGSAGEGPAAGNGFEHFHKHDELVADLVMNNAIIPVVIAILAVLGTWWRREGSRAGDNPFFRVKCQSISQPPSQTGAPLRQPCPWWGRGGACDSSVLRKITVLVLSKPGLQKRRGEAPKISIFLSSAVHFRLSFRVCNFFFFFPHYHSLIQKLK